MTSRTVEPYLLLRNKGEWYYVCWCRTADGMRVFRVATTKAARLLDEAFEPRAGIELDLYRREGIPTSASYAPRSATVWYSPVVRRWIEERQPVRPLPDGSCLASAALRGPELAHPLPAALRRSGAAHVAPRSRRRRARHRPTAHRAHPG